MNRFLLVISLGVCVLLGCSKHSAEKTNTGSNSAANNAIVANGNTEVIVPQAPLADANQNPAANAMIKPEFQKKLAANSGPAARPFQEGRPAPDDSTFTSTLTDVGRETRTFHKHPQLLKVEKVIEIGKQSIKVYLRNGSVIDLPGEKIPNLSTIPASEILRMAGVAASGTSRSAVTKANQ
jgi:hypothetical protein